jgi:hypothetical protein
LSFKVKGSAVNDLICGRGPLVVAPAVLMADAEMMMAASTRHMNITDMTFRRWGLFKYCFHIPQPPIVIKAILPDCCDRSHPPAILLNTSISKEVVN